MFVSLSLLVLANCARQIDPAQNALAERDISAQHISNNRQLGKMDGDYDRLTSNAMRYVPKVDVGTPTADIGLSRKNTTEERIIRDAEKDSKGFGSQTVPASMTIGRFSYPAPKDSSFLEGVKDDKENQLLKVKTNICRGC